MDIFVLCTDALMRNNQMPASVATMNSFRELITI